MKKYRVILIIFIIVFICMYMFMHTSLLYKIAYYLDEKGKFSQEEYILNLKLKLSPKNQSLRAKMKQSYALKRLIRFYYTQKDYKKIIALYESYIKKGEWSKLARDVLITQNVNEALVYSDLGRFYLLDTQYEKSILYYNKALELISEDYNFDMLSDIYDYAEIYNGLVYVYLAMTDYNNAKKNLDKSFELIKILPVDVLQTRFFTNLAASQYFLETKNYAKSEYYANQLFLTIPSKALPMKSYIRYQSYYLMIANNQMGKIKYQEQKYKEAEDFQRKELFITQEYYGEKSPKTICSYHTLLNTLKHEPSNIKILSEQDFIMNKISNLLRNLILYKNETIDLQEISKFCEK